MLAYPSVLSVDLTTNQFSLFFEALLRSLNMILKKEPIHFFFYLTLLDDITEKTSSLIKAQKMWQ